MKILMLTPYLPYPLLSGGQIRTYNLLKNLSLHHDITLFALIKDKSEIDHIKHLKPYCRQIKVFTRTRNPWAPRNIFLAGVTPYPFLITRNWPFSMGRAIKKELQTNPYDLIHAETFYMMPNIPKTKIPILLVEQTIEYLGYLYYAKTSPWFLKPLLYADIAKIKFWEIFYWKKASHLVTMSENDKQFIRSQIGKKYPIDVVANGVDVDSFTKTPRRLPSSPTILFVGTFKWLPNIDAVTYLVEKVWPEIKLKLPKAKLWIVGHSPTPQVMNYSRLSDITVTTNVKDIRDAYSRAHVLLAPIRSGKGTRYKVLEAMASGTPVVTTQLGAEGLDLSPGKHVLIGKSAKELTQATVTLLKDPKLQARLSSAAKEFVTKHYNWPAISADLDRLYRHLGQTNS